MLDVAGSRYLFHGHAIVSANDRITDATGLTPPSLRIEADWRRFQAALDRAAVAVLGRLGHEANPNRRGRNRLVLSSAVRALERRDDAWWWNPDDVPLAEALVVAAPAGGIVAVPGGRRVFDFFLNVGYDEFHLTRVDGVVVAGGVPIFSGIDGDGGAVRRLAEGGLRPAPVVEIDPGIHLTVWRKP